MVMNEGLWASVHGVTRDEFGWPLFSAQGMELGQRGGKMTSVQWKRVCLAKCSLEKPNRSTASIFVGMLNSDPDPFQETLTLEDVLPHLNPRSQTMGVQTMQSSSPAARDPRQKLVRRG